MRHRHDVRDLDAGMLQRQAASTSAAATLTPGGLDHVLDASDEVQKPAASRRCGRNRRCGRSPAASKHSDGCACSSVRIRLLPRTTISPSAIRRQRLIGGQDRRCAARGPASAGRARRRGPASGSHPSASDDAIGPVSLMPQVPTAWWSGWKLAPIAHVALAPGPLRIAEASAIEAPAWRDSASA